MNWEAVGAVSEFVGAIAVVVTLIYLAVQIRQNSQQIRENTNAVQAAAVHASLAYTFDNRAAVFSDEGTARIYEKGLNDVDSLDSTEELRFRLIINNVFDAFMNMHSQTKLSGFSPETWETQGVLLNRVLATSGGSAFWEKSKSAYPKAFQDDVERFRESAT